MSSSTIDTRPLSARRSANGLGCARLFFLVFLLAGAGFGYLTFLRPALKIIAARAWPEVPCSIVSSEVRSSSDGDTFRAQVRFRYRFDDRVFEGGNYDFTTAFSSGRKSKVEIVSRHPAGSEATCFVNPSGPSEAVIQRGWVRDLWWGLLPALFCAMGLGGLIFSRKIAGATSVVSATGLPSLPEVSADGSAVLKPSRSRFGTLVGIVLFAMFWNGVIAAIWLLNDRRPPMFLLIIFGGIGFLLVLSAAYQFLACLNPRPTLIADGPTVPLGGEFRLRWRFLGGTRRITRLRIFLRGTEQSTYRRGTDTTTDRHVFAELELANTTEPANIPSGEAGVKIPHDSMHTFIAPNNKVLWTLHFHGEIGHWPDVVEEFAINVMPSALSR